MDHHHSCELRSDRRGFIRLASLGATCALLGLPRVTRAAGPIEAVLLSCMDYRLLDDIAMYMQARGLKDNYDHLILAGASLGALTDQQPAWGETFWEHLGIALELHHVKRLMVMDHRDCGAYKVLLGTDHLKTRAAERATHAEMLVALREEAAKRHAGLPTELLLMNLDGTVETVG
ncbi:MAG TPA: carbonic anhydrase [Kiloniellales bacterium]|nr:carbonic anhydrase [Kiloniellales bacterium]